jgi:predicted acetyltransferase
MAAPARNDLIRLVRPCLDFKDSFLEGLREFQTEGWPWHLELDLKELQADFAGFVKRESDLAIPGIALQVPETKLWGILRNEYVGTVSIRHELNAELRIVGGHIGYDTRPGFRGQGIATAMLKGALPIARGLGLSKVLLTCSETNVSSQQVIEKNGGVLEKSQKIDALGTIKRYYWIQL